jgi:hypothetical protein
VAVSTESTTSTLSERGDARLPAREGAYSGRPKATAATASNTVPTSLLMALSPLTERIQNRSGPTPGAPARWAEPGEGAAAAAGTAPGGTGLTVSPK